ncbi:hypothetical protein [Marinococcus luteus]|uniref:hypothetical protein n=1 Tax=Marinococcus luteus TaxID=1122204 RepID=UPI002ACCF7CF|nr:hypothetical protein [Marinococcus luteus]MDZ5782117.1 hypothetical protein [Marinococcus luteus]
MAAVGEVVNDMTEVEYEDYLDIRPPEGEEWFIPNIYHANEAVLLKTNGDHEILFASDDDKEGGAWNAFKFFLDRDQYLRVRNVHSDGEASVIGYEGVRIR